MVTPQASAVVSATAFADRCCRRALFYFVYYLFVCLLFVCASAWFFADYIIFMRTVYYLQIIIVAVA